MCPGSATRRAVARVLFGMVPLLATLSACDKYIYGNGNIYLWNGSDKPVAFLVEGRTRTETELPASRGTAVIEPVAGPYTLKLTSRGQPTREVTFDLKAGETVVVNVDAASCMARSDIIGLYKSTSEPIRVIETYEPKEIIILGSVISVYPGELVPKKRPKNTMTFQRMSAVPCDLLKVDKKGQLHEFVRYQH